MKVRVYYNGYKDHYMIQYRWFGFWRYFTEVDVKALRMRIYCRDKIRFHTKEEAIACLNARKEGRKIVREQEAAAKEWSKKSGVVYEDVL